MSLTLPGYRPQRPPTRMERWTHWATSHWTQLALGASVFAVILFLGIAIVVSRAKLRERTAEILSSARFQAGSGKKKEALQSLDGVLKSDRTSPGALQAYAMKGELLFADGQIAEADAVYREALDQSHSPAYRPLFLAGRASCAVALQKPSEAVALLQQFLKEYPDHFLVPRVSMELGRVQFSEKKWAESQAAFERLVTLYPKSTWAQEAQGYLADIKTQLPAAQITPPVTPPAKTSAEKR